MSSASGDHLSETGSTRPRLTLKPRDETAARQAELERQKSSGNKNPFGEAKPREAILASRTGKSEQEIVKESVKAERVKLRLNAQQLEEKRAAEAAVEEIKHQIEAEGSTATAEVLQAELLSRQHSLDELLERFEKMALEAAQTGQVQRPSERRHQQQQQGALPSRGYGRSGEVFDNAHTGEYGRNYPQSRPSGGRGGYSGYVPHDSSERRSEGQRNGGRGGSYQDRSYGSGYAGPSSYDNTGHNGQDGSDFGSGFKSYSNRSSAGYGESRNYGDSRGQYGDSRGRGRGRGQYRGHNDEAYGRYGDSHGNYPGMGGSHADNSKFGGDDGMDDRRGYSGNVQDRY